MSTTLRKLHLFLGEHSFYILVLSSVLACSFFAWRFFYSGSTNYLNLISNLFLAWVPYGLSLLAAGIKRVRPHLWYIQLPLGFVWLLFFPNAPYLLTDFYHLGWRPPVPLWYDIGLITVFAFTGCFLAIASLRIMHVLVEQSLGTVWGWLFSLIALVLAGMGVYLGRIERWNSWDLVIHPRTFFAEFAEQLLNPLDNLGFVGFTLMFTSIMVIFYLFTSSDSRKKG